MPMLGYSAQDIAENCDLDALAARVTAAESAADAAQATVDTYDIRNFYVGPLVQYTDPTNRGTPIGVVIQGAITAAEASGIGGKIKIPDGKYWLGSDVRVRGLRGVHIEGAGTDATQLFYEPGVSGTAFLFDSTAQVGTVGTTLVNSSIRRLTVRGEPGAASKHAKVAVGVVCVSQFVCSEVTVIDWTTSLANAGEGPSKGFQWRGKEIAMFDKCAAVADRPFSIEANPKERASNIIDCDSLHIRDFYGVMPVDPALWSDQAAVHFDADLLVLNFLMDGINNVGGGKYGVYFRNPAGGAVSRDGVMFKVAGLRTEQQFDPTGATVFVSYEGTNKMYGLALEDINCNFETRGIYLQGCLNTTMRNVQYLRFSSQGTSPMALTITGYNYNTVLIGFLIPVVGGGTTLYSVVGQAVTFTSGASALSQLPMMLVYN